MGFFTCIDSSFRFKLIASWQFQISFYLFKKSNMDKNKFLDKIFEEFERRLTRVIELGYCSLSLDVENSLKTILTKTVNSSAGVQAKVLKEITTMKEYVVEVV